MRCTPDSNSTFALHKQVQFGSSGNPALCSSAPTPKSNCGNNYKAAKGGGDDGERAASQQPLFLSASEFKQKSCTICDNCSLSPSSCCCYGHCPAEREQEQRKMDDRNGKERRATKNQTFGLEERGCQNDLFG
jgi:hypothetical protein